jgi:hypothetical protein
MKDLPCKKRIFGMDDAEWDFNDSNVPSKSVLDCLRYEYARELVKRTPEATSTLKKLQAAKSSNDRELIWFHFEQMASFLKTKNCGSVLIYEYMDEVSWIRFQCLLEKQRRMLIKRKRLGHQRPKVVKGKKVEVSKVIHPNELDDCDDLLYWGRGLALLKNPPNESKGLYEKFNCSIRSANAVLDTDVRRESCGFFAVDLKASIPDILSDFKNWLVQEKKRAGILDPERRGGISEEKRAYVWLNALGAYRLMTMTNQSVGEIIDTFERRLQRPPLYPYAPEWSRAKKIVKEAMQALFVNPPEADS